MAMFIKLHEAKDYEIRINMSMVESYITITNELNFCSDNCIGMTYVNMLSDEGRFYVVKETPEEIDEMLKERG